MIVRQNYIFFLESVALFHLKLQGKYLLHASTIQSIISEFEECHEMSRSIMMHRLCDKLSMADVSPQSY